MPTAIPFTALGRGNGFPFCVTKKDVSGFTNWITLGGVSSGSASKSQVNESFGNAMKLWWNLNSITGSFSVSSTNSADGNLSVSETNYELILKRNGESDPLVPTQRSCRGTSSSTSFSLGELASGFSKTASVANDGVSGEIQVGNNNFIVRMYNGSTDNEDNFVGYGVSQLAHISGFADVRNVQGAVDIEVGSYINGTNDSGVDPDTGITFDVKVFQTTLDGIPFRSKSLANAAESGGSLSLSTSELSASATANSSLTGPPAINTSANVSASLSSIDFYTYN